MISNIARLLCFVAVCCLAAQCVRCDESLTPEEWLETFDEMFEKNNEKGYATKRQLVQHFDLLREGVDQLNDERIEQPSKDLVTKWHDQYNDKDPQHCTRFQFDDLTRQYDKHRFKNNRNFEQVYFGAQMNLIKFCSLHHVGVARVLESKDDDRRLFTLLFEFKEQQNHAGNKTYEKRFRQQIFSLIHVDKKAPVRDILQAWSKGPCNAVLGSLTEPAMEEHSQFIDFAMSLPLPYFNILHAPTRIWLEVIEMCKSLTEMMPDIASHGSVQKKAVRTVNNLFG